MGHLQPTAVDATMNEGMNIKNIHDVDRHVIGITESQIAKKPYILCKVGTHYKCYVYC